LAAVSLPVECDADALAMRGQIHQELLTPPVTIQACRAATLNAARRLFVAGRIDPVIGGGFGHVFDFPARKIEQAHSEESTLKSGFSHQIEWGNTSPRHASATPSASRRSSCWRPSLPREESGTCQWRRRDRIHLTRLRHIRRAIPATRCNKA